MTLNVTDLSCQLAGKNQEKPLEAVWVCARMWVHAFLWVYMSIKLMLPTKALLTLSMT